MKLFDVIFCNCEIYSIYHCYFTKNVWANDEYEVKKIMSELPGCDFVVSVKEK